MSRGMLKVLLAPGSVVFMAIKCLLVLKLDRRLKGR